MNDRESVEKVKFAEDDYSTYLDEFFGSDSAKWWIENREINNLDRTFFMTKTGWRKLFTSKLAK